MAKATAAARMRAQYHLVIARLLIARSGGGPGLTGAAEAEHAAAVRQDHRPAVDDVRVGLSGGEALHRDRFADLQRVAAPALAPELVRRAAFDGVVDEGAVGLLDVDVEVDVRVLELHLRDRAGERDRLAGVELRGKRMVRRGGRRGPGQDTRREQYTEHSAFHRRPPLPEILHPLRGKREP